MVLPMPMPMKMSRVLRAALQSQKLVCDGFVIYVGNEFCSPWVYYGCFMPKSDQMKAPSFLLRILSHTVPHFTLSLGGMISRHLVKIALGGGFRVCDMFFPIANVLLRKFSHEFHCSHAGSMLNVSLLPMQTSILGFRLPLLIRNGNMWTITCEQRGWKIIWNTQ